MTVALGVLLIVFRSAAVSCAENMQKYAQRNECPNKVMNTLGVLLQVVTAPVDAIAYSIAPQSVLAPVGMLGLLFNLMAASRLHGEVLSSLQVLATMCIAAGTIICVMNGASASADNVELSVYQYSAYATVVAPLCVALLCVPRLNLKVQFPAAALASASACGLLGSSTVVASKIIGSQIQSPGRTVFSVIASAVPVAVLAPFHVFVMNRCFGLYSLLIMSPVSGSAGLIANVATGFFSLW